VVDSGLKEMARWIHEREEKESEKRREKRRENDRTETEQID
jgi:hypothetical protein